MIPKLIINLLTMSSSILNPAPLLLCTAMKRDFKLSHSFFISPLVMSIAICYSATSAFQMYSDRSDLLAGN